MTRSYLDWKLAVFMERKKIRKPQLHRMLEEAGYKISSVQLDRVISKRPKKLNIEQLEALLHVLECDVSDLLVLDKLEASDSPDVIPIRRKRPTPF